MNNQQLKIGDKVDFLFTHGWENDKLADFGTVYNIFDDYIVVRPYRSRSLLKCTQQEVKKR